MGQRIVIVAYDGVATLDITGPADVFTEAARQLGDGNAYRVELTSMGGGARRTTSGITVHSRDLARVRPRASDTVLVAGGGERALRAAVADDGLRRWLQHANGRVDRMGSVCSGVFVLATAGLLAGRRVATHWQACGPLANMFPDLSVDSKFLW